MSFPGGLDPGAPLPKKMEVSSFPVSIMRKVFQLFNQFQITEENIRRKRGSVHDRELEVLD